MFCRRNGVDVHLPWDLSGLLGRILGQNLVSWAGCRPHSHSELMSRFRFYSASTFWAKIEQSEVGAATQGKLCNCGGTICGTYTPLHATTFPCLGRCAAESGSRPCSRHQPPPPEAIPWIPVPPTSSLHEFYQRSRLSTCLAHDSGVLDAKTSWRSECSRRCYRSPQSHAMA